MSQPKNQKEKGRENKAQSTGLCHKALNVPGACICPLQELKGWSSLDVLPRIRI